MTTSTRNGGRRLVFGGLAAIGAGLMARSAARRAVAMRAVAPELRHAGLLAMPAVSSWLVSVVRAATAVMPAGKSRGGVSRSEHLVSYNDGATTIRAVIFQRPSRGSARPALLWMHGGGFVMGAPGQDIGFVSRLLDRMDIVIVSVDYRLASQNPYPAALDDCHAVLTWLAEHARSLGVDPAYIAIGGGSAGGGLAAALTQRVVDEGPVMPVMQLLVYPMLDDRTTVSRKHKGRDFFLWNVSSNRMAWRKYLGSGWTSVETLPYAVPARRHDLAGMPVTWIGVGSLDLFRDEAVAYGARLRDAGVDCTVHEVAGAYHCFDVINPQAPQTSNFYESMIDSLRRALSGTGTA